MREHDLFIGGPLHGMRRPCSPEPANTFTCEDDKGNTTRYRLAELVIAGSPREVFVAEGYDLALAQVEAARFAPVFG